MECDGHRRAGRRARPVTTLATPIRLDFDFTPGVAQSKFLRGLEQGTFVAAVFGVAQGLRTVHGAVPQTAYPRPMTYCSPLGTVTPTA